MATKRLIPLRDFASPIPMLPIIDHSAESGKAYGNYGHPRTSPKDVFADPKWKSQGTAVSPG